MTNIKNCSKILLRLLRYSEIEVKAKMNNVDQIVK